jgi:hypothetical protein
MRDWTITDPETKAAQVEVIFGRHPSFLELARKLVRVLAKSEARDCALAALRDTMDLVDQAPRQEH